MLSQWEVKLHKQGRPMTEIVNAHTQQEAREKALRLNPGYKTGATKRI